MAKISTGVDIIDIERVREAIERHGERFLLRVFTPCELEESGQNPASLAARFAAKEAAAKALGTGIGEVGWREIEVRRDAARRPQLFLHGEARRLAEENGLIYWSLSLSHTAETAIALVVCLGD